MSEFIAPIMLENTFSERARFSSFKEALAVRFRISDIISFDMPEELSLYTRPSITTTSLFISMGANNRGFDPAPFAHPVSVETTPLVKGRYE